MNDTEYQSGQYKAGVKCALDWIKNSGDMDQMRLTFNQYMLKYVH